VKVAPVWEFRVIFDAENDATVMECLTALCEGVIRANMVWLRYHGAPCCLAAAGVKYVLPDGCGARHPCQTVRGAAEMFRQGVGTCIDVACYVAAQLRLKDHKAKAVFTNMKDRGGRPIPGQYHALVETDHGIYDYTQDLIEGRCSIDCGA